MASTVIFLVFEVFYLASERAFTAGRQQQQIFYVFCNTTSHKVHILLLPSILWKLVRIYYQFALDIAPLRELYFASRISCYNEHSEGTCHGLSFIVSMYKVFRIV